jgi:hypothetical protein
MRNGQVGGAEFQLSIKKNVDIQGTGPTGKIPNPSRLTFHFKALAEQLQWLPVCLHVENRIDEPGLVGNIPGFGNVQ